MLLIAPIILIIIALQLLFNKADVFYLQNRIGLNNKDFKIIKFSSMLKNSMDLPGGSITIRNDPRVTRTGKTLRFTKLNELPQLFNVLIGDMSFVGPRPLVTKGFNLYPPDVKAFLYKSKPGITGISSVVFRDEEIFVTKSKMDPHEYYKKHIFPFKGQLEEWYYNNKSLWVDFIILFLTGIKILFPNSKLEYSFFPSLPKSKHFKF